MDRSSNKNRGIIKHGVHAAGVVISSEPVMNLCLSEK